MTRLEEVMARIGSRPALIRMANAADHFGESAPYRIEEAVAIIDVVGPLSNEAWSWRGTTYGEIQDQIKIASADPNVKGILLNVNSPGGVTDNAFETAAMIAAIEKPCYAVANTAAYSAAYLLASQADRVYCVETSGGVGSIGVYCAHFDYAEMLKQAGINVTLFSAGKGKTDGNPYEPLSESAKENIQADIDRLYGEFVGSVAKGRKMSATDIVKMGARCCEGAKSAISAGLADASGDLSTAWVDLCTEIQRPSLPMIGASSAATAATKEPRMAEKQAAGTEVTQMQPIPTAAEVEAMVATAIESGRAEASTIAAMCALVGKTELIPGFLSAKKTAVEVGAELMKLRVDAEKGTGLNTAVTPGVDAEANKDNQGKAKPWGDVLKALGFKKEGK